MNKEIEFEYLYWGPLVTKFKLENNFSKELLDRGRKCKEDARSILAGILDREFLYGQEDINWFCEKFSPYLNRHMNFLNHYHNKMFEVNLHLDKLWINFMDKQESNPLHIHSGNISFVIYLKIPEALKKENEKYIGTDTGGPGAIKFFNSLSNDEMNIGRHSIFPEENTVFIFPATLNHMVVPFKTEDERISVSGNFHFIEKDTGKKADKTYIKNRPIYNG